MFVVFSTGVQPSWLQRFYQFRGYSIVSLSFVFLKKVEINIFDWRLAFFTPLKNMSVCAFFGHWQYPCAIVLVMYEIIGCCCILLSCELTKQNCWNENWNINCYFTWGKGKSCWQVITPSVQFKYESVFIYTIFTNVCVPMHCKLIL